MAFRSLRRIAAEDGFEVDWRPVQVGGVFNAVNDSVYRFRAAPIPAKDAYIAKDMQDWARRGGGTIRWRPSIFPVNSVKAMRGCLVAREHGLLEPFADAVFEAYWSQDRNIADLSVLADLWAFTGLDKVAAIEQIERPDIREALRANTDELIRRGGYGVPTFFVGGSDMYFGNDRVELVREAVARRQVGAISARP